MRAWLPRCKWVVSKLLVWVGDFHTTHHWQCCWSLRESSATTCAASEGPAASQGSQPCLTFQGECGWFKKAENWELNSYHLLGNLCILSWQQNSFPFICKVAAGWGTLQYSCEIKSRPEETHLPQHSENYRAMLPITLKGLDGNQEFLPLSLKASVRPSQELVLTRSRIKSSLAGSNVQPQSAPSTTVHI